MISDSCCDDPKLGVRPDACCGPSSELVFDEFSFRDLQALRDEALATWRKSAKELGPDAPVTMKFHRTYDRLFDAVKETESLFA